MNTYYTELLPGTHTTLLFIMNQVPLSGHVEITVSAFPLKCHTCYHMNPQGENKKQKEKIIATATRQITREDCSQRK
ncbi:MAG: hypothetical protein ABI863_07400 [Ginsengibacter sp.]